MRCFALGNVVVLIRICAAEMVNTLRFDTAPAGFVILTEIVPAAERRKAGTLIVSSVLLTYETGSVVAFQSAEQPGWKPDPFTFTVSGPLPATAADGDRLLRAGLTPW